MTTDRAYAYVPHGLETLALQLGWVWLSTLPRPHGLYADLWERRCCCGRPATHPRAARKAAS